MRTRATVGLTILVIAGSLSLLGIGPRFSIGSRSVETLSMSYNCSGTFTLTYSSTHADYSDIDFHSFKLKRSMTETGSYTQVASTGQNDNVATFSNQSRGYWYKGSAEWRPPGGESGVYWTSAGPVEFPALENVSTPTGLSAGSPTTASVSLSWTAVTGGHRYKLERSPNGSSGWTTVDSNISGTSKTVTGLDSGTTYYFRVRAKGDGTCYSTSWSAASSSVSGRTSLPNVETPTGLNVTGSTQTSVSLSWTAPTGGHRYWLQRSPNGTSGWTNAGLNFSGTSKTASGLTCNTTYYFRVRAKGDGTTYSTIWSPPTSNVSRTTSTCPNAPPPTGLNVTGSPTTSSVSLSWTAPTGGHRYWLQRSPNGSSGWTTVDSNISGTSKTASGLTCNTTYYFRARTKGDGSPYSTTFGSATSNDVAGTTSTCPNAPPPTGLSATGSTQTSVSLSWTAVTGGHRYKLERSPNGSSGWTTVDSNISGTSKTASGLTCNTTYYFRARTKGDGSPYSTTFGSATSNDVSGTTSQGTVSTPTGLGVTATSTSSVSLSWDAVTNADAYKLEYGTSTSGLWDSFETSSTSVMVTGLTPSTAYYFRVSAKGNGTSCYSTDWSGPSPVISARLNSPPEFNQATYTREVPEDKSIGYEVVTVSATDPDTGDTVSYSITAGNSEGKFSLGSSGDTITVADTLNYESTTDYSLEVTASDGNDTDTATVNITVDNVNERPTFDQSPYSFTVREGETLSFGRVSASDPDGDSVTYEIIAGDDEMFSIGDGNGIMVAAPTLDYERKWFYILTVRASDGDLFGTSTANITVEDVNEVSITGPAGAVTEGEAMSFTVSVESTTASELTVGYNLYGGTAVFGDDYTSSHSCTHTVHTTYCDVTIPANSDTETIQLATIADGTDEAHETVVVELSLVSSTADVVIDKQPSRKKVTSRIASPIGVPAIGDNGSQTSTVEVASVATSTLRFDLTGLDAGRAYAVRITARGTAVGAVSVEPGATEPPGFAHIGGGQFVWVEYGSVPSERTVVVTFPRDSTTTTLDVTVSKPDLVFIERPTAEVPVWGSTNTTGTVNLSMTIFNSTSQDSDDDESEIKVSCDPERSNYHATRTHSFDSLRGSAGGSLIGAGDREIVFVRSVCQGAALSAGTSQTTADEFSFRIRVVVDGETLHEVRLPHPDDEYRWPFAVNDTLWHPQTTTTAGLQILPSGCTLSFPLEVRARDGTGTVETAVSTTGHCTERGQTWEQGSYPLVGGPANVPLGTAQMVPSSTTCRILDSDGMETVHDCRRGDHAYAWGENPTTATAIFRPAEENEGNVNRPKIDYFAKDADVTFEIVGARPPDEDDTVHKVGRTTGWTKGRIEDFKNRGGNDSSCPGNEVGIDDHKVYVDAAKTIVDYHIECLVWAWFASAGGDSGSPVFVLRDNPDTADAVEVLLVGVLWGGFAHNDGWFIPIERVYAESLLQDKDWLPEWLRPLPVLDGAREELELAADGSAIVATFDKRDLSQGRGLTYEAVLYRNGGQVEDTDGDVYSIEVSRGTDDSSSLVRISFTVSRIPVDQRNGTFTVRVRLCPYVDSSDAATPTDSYCGGYGSDGGTSLTVPPAPENLSVTRASNGITTIVWDAVANAALYRVAHMQTHTGWTELPDVTTTDTKTTLSCESYDFRVRAKGNESSYSSLWGFWSEPVALPSSCSVGISEKEGEENEEE